MKKNWKRFAALAMALCLSLSMMSIASAATNEATSSGGSATSNVTLSSTDDGTMGGNPAATAMSVTVPTVLPVAVGTDGAVTTATNCVITNNSYGAVKVSGVTISAAQGWALADFDTNMAGEKVDSNQVGFALAIGGGEQQTTDGSDADSQTLLTDAITGCYMTGAGDQTKNTVAVAYDAVVSPVSSAVTNTGTGKAPTLSGRAAVYGQVAGDVRLTGTALVISGEKICNDTKDALVPPYASGGRTQAEKNRSTSKKYSSMGDKSPPPFDGDAKDQRSWTRWAAEWLYEARRARERIEAAIKAAA